MQLKLSFLVLLAILLSSIKAHSHNRIRDKLDDLLKSAEEKLEEFLSKDDEHSK
jgi:hypothetical protein